MNLKELNNIALRLTMYFSSMAGLWNIIIILSISDSIVNGFAFGKMFAPRLDYYTDSSAISWVAFAISMFITLGLSYAMIVSTMQIKIDINEIKDAQEKAKARKANRNLDSLKNTLAWFSGGISLMSVGIFMFDGISYNDFLSLIKTPFFWCQFIALAFVAGGIPKALVRLSSFLFHQNQGLLVKEREEMMKEVGYTSNQKKSKTKQYKREQPSTTTLDKLFGQTVNN